MRRRKAGISSFRIIEMDLVDDLWLCIFSFIHPFEILSLATVCKRWNRLSCNQSLWVNVFSNFQSSKSRVIKKYKNVFFKNKTSIIRFLVETSEVIFLEECMRSYRINVLIRGPDERYSQAPLVVTDFNSQDGTVSGVLCYKPLVDDEFFTLDQIRKISQTISKVYNIDIKGSSMISGATSYGDLTRAIEEASGSSDFQVVAVTLSFPPVKEAFTFITKIQKRYSTFIPEYFVPKGLFVLASAEDELDVDLFGNIPSSFNKLSFNTKSIGGMHVNIREMYRYRRNIDGTYYKWISFLRDKYEFASSYKEEIEKKTLEKTCNAFIQNV